MHLNSKSEISITYLFKRGRRKRLALAEEIPSEFFYGYKELCEEGYKVNLFEEIDLEVNLNNIFIKKFLNLISRIFFNLPLLTISSFLLKKSFKKLNKVDIIICTTNSLGITLSFAKKLGLIKSEILFINMGLFQKNINFLKLYLYRYLFKQVKLITISIKEYQILNKYFNNVNVFYIPFGVDQNFWIPDKKINKNPFVLAIGNDQARDWDILIDCWDENFPILKIVTSIPIENTKKNIEIIKGNWHSQLLTDLDMRDLYRNSEFLILTLKETIQPSGQSTCLQAMACSKAVVISNIKGIWDRNLLKHRENIFFVKPYDKYDLHNAIIELINNRELRLKLEKNGRKLITDHFNILNMKNNLKKTFEEI